MTTTFEEVAGWLRTEGDRVYDRWVDLIGHDRAMRKAKFWRDRAAQVEAMGWRPIAEAPRDGTIVDLWESNTEDRIPDCMWVKGAWHQFQYPDEWLEIMYGTITHFMYLPDPPKEK